MNNTQTKPDSALLVTSVLEGKACESNEALPGTSPSSLRTGFFIPLLLPHHQDQGDGNGGKKCTLVHSQYPCEHLEQRPVYHKDLPPRGKERDS